MLDFDRTGFLKPYEPIPADLETLERVFVEEFTIEQFTEQRDKYVGQLALLLNQYGLVVQLPTPPDNAGRLAA
ncbi:MAG: hypothetical protein EAZ91_05575 [Cytophagales bacterium]|nr:MAG: hypothetical protein EAZ91_05575 [Cytophagales bacterium]